MSSGRQDSILIKLHLSKIFHLLSAKIMQKKLIYIISCLLLPLVMLTAGKVEASPTCSIKSGFNNRVFPVKVQAD
jgi:hypothetical protein